jgi:hypothetical protein
MEGNHSLVVPLSEDGNMPALPPSGVATGADVANVKGAKVLDGGIVLWGPKPGLAASIHYEVHRNLYRVPLQ